MRHFLKDENGAGAIIEAVFVLPLLIVIILALYMTAIYASHRIILQTAVNRVTSSDSFKYSDSLLESYMEDNQLKYRLINPNTLTEADINPYYKLIGNLFGSGNKVNEDDIKKSIKTLASRGIFKNTDDIAITFSENNYVVYRSFTVHAKWKFAYPINLKLLGITDNNYYITASATTTIVNGDEFIRNVDMAIDFLEDIGVTKKISEIFDKVKSFLDNFF